MNVKLTEKDKIQVNDPEDLYEIMKRILLRDNKIDRDKEHFWIVGMNGVGIILFIELISLGTGKATLVEPMEVYRVAVLKGASCLWAVHNHPSGNLKPSQEDKDVTDRLLQVGKILNIKLYDHMIITTESYYSFEKDGLMDVIAQSTRYVPAYQLIEKIRKEEKGIRVELEKDLKQSKKELQEYKIVAVKKLLENQMTIEQIADILQLSPEEVKKISRRKKK